MLGTLHSVALRVVVVLVVAMLSTAVTSCQQASDGLLIVWTSRSGARGETVEHPIYLEAHRFRYDIVLDGAVVERNVFDAGARRFYQIRERDKEYAEVTSADLDRMWQDIEKEGSNVPKPAGVLGNTWQKSLQLIARPKVQPSQVGKATVGSVLCTRFELFDPVLQRPDGELCLAARTDVPLPADDLAVAREWRDFVMHGIPAQYSGSSFEPPPVGLDGFLSAAHATFGLEGVLIKATRRRGGDYPTTLEVSQIVRRRLPDSTFAVPSDFTKREFPSELLRSFWHFY